ncbi:MAG: Tryptophan synthase alpha chain [bacterium]|nr:Tryptophan synthase alpha chain [bacterium]
MVAAGGCGSNGGVAGDLGLTGDDLALASGDLGPAGDDLALVGDDLTTGASCAPTNGGVEICDGVDNDCNGVVDDPFTATLTGGTPNYDSDVANCGACGAACALPHAVNKCVAGTGGKGVCQVDHCVNTPTVATFKHRPGLDINVTGCEYQCPVASSTAGDCQNSPGACSFPAEVCNGSDDDCNFLVDDNPTDGDLGSPCGDACPGGLVTNCVGACSAGSKQCQNGAKVCIGSTGPTTEVCDHIDNDCNGSVDDPFTRPAPFGYLGGDPTKPLYNLDVDNCGDCNGSGGKGFACQLANAVNGCHSASPNAQGNCYVVSCNASWYFVTHAQAGASCIPSGSQRDSTAGNVNSGVGCFYQCGTSPLTSESCNGADDDCNGCVDDGIHDPVVQLSVAADPGYQGRPAHTVFVATDEASRPDATATSAGSLATRACAKSGVLPWSNVTEPQAAAACAWAGGRLCTALEWQTACEGPSPSAPPRYSQAPSPSPYMAGVCNDANFTAHAVWATASTGSAAGQACYTDWGSGNHLDDLSGNLEEWTATQKFTYQQSGSDGVLSFVSAGRMRLTSASLVTVNIAVGDPLLVSGSPVAAHNGTFAVVGTTASSVDLADAAISASFTNESNIDWQAQVAAQSFALRGGAYTSSSSGTTCEFGGDTQASSYTAADVGFRCCFDTKP